MAYSKILTVEDLNEQLEPNLHADELNFSISEDNQLVERAFSELRESGVVEGDPVEEHIRYYTGEGDNIVLSRYACFESNAYISWIWVIKPIRGNGYGKEIVLQTLKRLKDKNVNKIYALPKSDKALSIFKSLGFKPSSEVGSGWFVKM